MRGKLVARLTNADEKSPLTRARLGGGATGDPITPREMWSDFVADF